jgi:hypothetical protein
MIAWTDELITHIDSSSRAALSYLGASGFPVTLPSPFTFDRGEHHFTLPRPGHPPAISAKAASQTSLTLLRYDPQVANERYLLFYGYLEERGTEWFFTPSRVVL